MEMEQWPEGGLALRLAVMGRRRQSRRVLGQSVGDLSSIYRCILSRRRRIDANRASAMQAARLEGNLERELGEDLPPLPRSLRWGAAVGAQTVLRSYRAHDRVIAHILPVGFFFKCFSIFVFDFFVAANASSEPRTGRTIAAPNAARMLAIKSFFTGGPPLFPVPRNDPTLELLQAIGAIAEEGED